MHILLEMRACGGEEDTLAGLKHKFDDIVLNLLSLFIIPNRKFTYSYPISWRYRNL